LGFRHAGHEKLDPFEMFKIQARGETRVLTLGGIQDGKKHRHWSVVDNRGKPLNWNQKIAPVVQTF
jgi:hypothetical protein